MQFTKHWALPVALCGRQKNYTWALPSSDKEMSRKGRLRHSSHSQAVPLHIVPSLFHGTSFQQAQFWPLEPLSSTTWQNTALVSTLELPFSCPIMPSPSPIPPMIVPGFPTTLWVFSCWLVTPLKYRWHNITSNSICARLGFWSLSSF